MTESVEDAARRFAAPMIAKGYELEALHVYSDANGKPIYWRIRCKNPKTGNKWIRPMRLNGQGYELKEPDFPTGKKPLYRLDAIAAAATATVVYVTEGEKPADALVKLGAVATTSGSATSATDAHWEPLRGRDVVIFPDNDDSGQSYAGAAAKMLLDVGCNVWSIEPDTLGLPPKGDAVEWLAAHPDATLADLEALPRKEARFSPEDGTDDEEDSGDKKGTAAEQLIEIGLTCDLFHDERNDAYAVTNDAGVRRVLRQKSKLFTIWLRGQYYATTGKAARGEAITSARGVLEAKAIFDANLVPLSNRFAEHDGALYIDLCDARWRAVRVTAQGWEVLDTPPVLFRRHAHQQPLPDPVRGASLAELRPFLNVRHDDDWHLVEAWLATAVFSSVPRPALALHGVQGAAKSTSARVLKKLLDPSATESVDLGRDPAALAQVLDHNAVPCFDNLTGIPPWAADMLCRAVTGGAHSKRELYSDSDDVIVAFMRSLIITGINIPTHAPDLLDRMLLIELERIAPEKRQHERALRTCFEATWPRLFGALLDAIVGILNHRDRIELDRLPRMADFAQLACAYAESTGLGAETMLSIITTNAKRQIEEVVESDPLASAIREFTKTRVKWEGTATELWAALNDGLVTSPEGWPRSAKSLGRRLKVLQTTLIDAGVFITTGKKSADGNNRLITLAWLGRNQTSESSESSERSANNDLAPDVSTKGRAPYVRETSEQESNEIKPSDISDNTDINSPPVAEDEVEVF